MKKIVVFQFTLFDESNKELAKEIAIEVFRYTNTNSWGEFCTFELTKELMKIDESVETIKIVPDGVTEPAEVKIQQQDEGKLPTNIQKRVQAYEFLGQAIDVAKQAKDMGVGAAGKAIGLGMNYYRNKKEKEVKAQLEPKLGSEQRNIWVQLPEAQKRGLFEVEKQNKIREEEERRKKQAEEIKQRKIREEKMRKQAEEMKQKKIREEEMRKQAEEMKQKKIREEEMRKQAEEMKQKKIREEKMRKRAAEMKQKKIREEKMRKQAEEMKQKKIREEKMKKQAEEMKQKEEQRRKQKEEEKLKIWQEKMKNSGACIILLSSDAQEERHGQEPQGVCGATYPHKQVHGWDNKPEKQVQQHKHNYPDEQVHQRKTNV
ncbi:hypothetical protein Bca52824_085755 [Brassica carinata]|uniref:Uncharacterized protein n=1 Tax=Brassica carinata TaxID=52824 RepID=A0A8X7P8D8_BRACI|nr:hypothetical protein Bca52824_085755 [Brassica carinata]